jgi:hypothetical protein
MTAPLAGRVHLAGRAPLVGRGSLARSAGAGTTTRAALSIEGALELTARLWAATAALGLGLVTAGTGSGHLAHHLPVGLALSTAGLVAVGWSLAALRGPAPAPRAAVAGLLVTGPAVLASAPLTATAVTAAHGAALVLALGAAILLALARREATAPGPRRPVGPGATAGVLAAGALLVALVTVPGLAATEAGAHAVPHGSHGLPAEQGHHGGH